jgi:hypothetical protein
MGTKHPNPNLAKIHLTYSVDEIARLLSVSRGTVRRWLKTGLAAVEGPGLTIVRGSVLREFLRKRRADGKRPCGPGFLYCLRCRVPRQPAGARAELICSDPHAAEGTGNLRGICPDCSALMYRRVNVGRLSAVRGNLDIALPDAQSRLRGIHRPCLNGDLSDNEQQHENA